MKKIPRISRVIAGKRAALARKPRATQKQSQQYLDMVAPSSRQASVYGELHRITLTLDSFTIERLVSVGGGSASEGARRLARVSLQGVAVAPFIR